jgi:hypothetical protein
MYMGLTIYLLFSIGLKGGVKLQSVSIADFYKPGLAAIAMCIAIPIVAYLLLHKLGKFDKLNAAAVAAHFGSVSAVTFSEGTAFLDLVKILYEGYMPAMLAIMEIPAIIIAIYIAKKAMPKTQSNMGKVMHELFTN